MHIIKPIQSQQIKFIMRTDGVPPNFKIIDESRNKDITSDVQTATGGYADGITTFNMTFKADKLPVEGRFYTFTGYNASTGALLYMGRLFCTSQTEYDKYTVNQNVYTEEESYNNEFILL
jgi:hypothetical protein